MSSVLREVKQEKKVNLRLCVLMTRKQAISYRNLEKLFHRLMKEYKYTSVEHMLSDIKLPDETALTIHKGVSRFLGTGY